jgi:sugar lactone lactonase YvrE
MPALCGRRFSMRNHIPRLLAIVLLSLAITVPLTGSAAAQSGGLNRIGLPPGFQPEGIAIRGHTAYLGSLADGRIIAVNLRTGVSHVINDGPGTPSVGLKVDSRGRLFVAGGPAGNARVISTKTGRLLATYQFPSAPTFINDVVLTRSAAWFTDSMQAQLYEVPFGRHGQLPGQPHVMTLTLTGDWQQVPDQFNANGIAQTPDRRALLVINSQTGLLYRVDPETGVATQVDLGGDVLNFGDGLLLDGRILYVVQNRLNQVAVVKLNRSGTKGMVVSQLTSPTFDVPTTVARKGHSLYLPNARFGTAATLDTDYWITRIDTCAKNRNR